MRKLLMLLSFTVMTVCLFCMSSCAVTKKVDKQTTIVNDTVRNTIVQYDTVTVQVADTVRVEGKDVVKQVDVDYEHQLDSLGQANALKDKRIATLLAQIANKDFHIDPVYADAGNAHASAGVDYNKLWLKLDVDSVTAVNKTTTDNTVITNTTDTATSSETVKQYSCWTSPWFYGFWLLAIACIGLLVIVIKLIVLPRL